MRKENDLQLRILCRSALVDSLDSPHIRRSSSTPPAKPSSTGLVAGRILNWCEELASQERHLVSWIVKPEPGMINLQETKTTLSTNHCKVGVTKVRLTNIDLFSANSRPGTGHRHFQHCLCLCLSLSLPFRLSLSSYPSHGSQRRSRRFQKRGMERWATAYPS
jgi:hypothetical protein